MDTEWQAVKAAAQTAWPEEASEPSLRWNGTHYQATYPAPMGEVDATAPTPEGALAALAARIGGDAYALKVAVRRAEAEKRLAEIESEKIGLTAEVANWTKRAKPEKRRKPEEPA